MTKQNIKWHARLVKKVLSDPEGAAEYKAFKFQLELAEKLKRAAPQSMHDPRNSSCKGNKKIGY